MPTTGELPIHNQPTKRHHKTHYHVQRVRESLTSRVGKFLCATLLSLLLVSGIVVFILWLNLRPHRPRFHIRSFSFPALAQDTGFENAQITFNVTIRNSNQKIGIYYYTMKGAVYYQDQPIGGSQLPFPSSFPYYQEPKNTVWIQGQLNPPTTLVITNDRWKALMADRSAGKVLFRLELKSTIQFKVQMWDTKRHTMHATCLVTVGHDGQILPVSKNKKCPLYFN
ncbi:hypothetical protein NE237_002216 [Protea cynaroides]|uniref:Late embryogenesis abundant protein LEA-2 subgroup domain-containing protein n=1 Tax=Protea cynaroides TaxID=273540 RepID=A0A9Q0QYU4_9MAGN|nr:hypothetical protein NE237_002216 [Protea cynaroides]